MNVNNKIYSQAKKKKEKESWHKVDEEDDYNLEWWKWEYHKINVWGSKKYRIKNYYIRGMKRVALVEDYMVKIIKLA